MTFLILYCIMIERGEITEKTGLNHLRLPYWERAENRDKIIIMKMAVTVILVLTLMLYGQDAAVAIANAAANIAQQAIGT